MQLNEKAMQIAKERWNNLAIPLDSLGKMQQNAIKLAGIYETDDFILDKYAVVVMCGDNGIVEEGVTQTGQVVTKIVAENMTTNKATIGIMSEQIGADVFVVDVGIATEYDNQKIINKNVMKGTNNFAKTPAMTKQQVQQAMDVGIDMVRELKNKGYKMIATGEMGIGNTTTSSAITACILNKDAAVVTGYGAGLTSDALKLKIDLINTAIEYHKVDKNDMMDILSKVGGLDIAAMVGMYLGGAKYRIPIIIDGFISGVAALVAIKMDSRVRDFMFASHMSMEPAAKMILEEIDLPAMLHLDMRLGEGTGAVMSLNIFTIANTIYRNMSDFDDAKVEKYVRLK